ncbi:Nitrilotriacetate monooxygenase component A [Carnimonas sp. R-84981]|uniref:LLM class flavin-dependent oxidoreductase n=1 Tax=Carnimonas bestiolae TaxID=3402172 RepID=UPI003EDC3BB6
MTAPLKQAHFNVFLFGVGHHRAAWRQPHSQVERLGDVSFYEALAQTAERGRLDGVFFADGHAAIELSDGPRWFLEPITLLSAMARATERVGLITTISSTFGTPFHTARQLASLDYISHGRVGWNLVTSMFDPEARNHGYDKMPPHAERYARAEEMIQVVEALWDSWDDGEPKMDRNGWYANAERVRAVQHHGRFFDTEGPLTVPRPPQGHPVLFQAGASEQGRELAARYAEAIYAVAWDIESAQHYYRDIKRRVSAAGRTVDVPIMPGLVTYVAATEAEARQQQQQLDDALPVASSLSQLEVFIEQDCSQWALDAPVPTLPPLEEFNGPKGRYATILRIIEDEQPTLRQLLGRLAAGGGHCTMVGTPEQIADRIEHWLDNDAADGFNLMPPTLPEGLDDFVDHVIPELQRRGRFRSDYQGTTLREHLGLERPTRR